MCGTQIKIWPIDIIYFASPHRVKSLKRPILQMGESSITPYLGVIFDQCINMYELVASVCRASYYHLKNIHCLKALWTQEALVTVVHAFVSYRIISDYNINGLRRIHKSAAHIVPNT